MSVTRGAFIKSLGKSLPGIVLGSGAAVAHKLFSKMAAASGELVPPVTSNLPEPRTYPKPIPAEIVSTGPTERKQIALTFDDGPTPGVTERILDDLKQRNARATFFMIGERIAAAPALARRVLAEGHEIGNHTFTHPKLTELSFSRVDEEIQKTQDVIATILGLKPAWFRPPYLAFRDNLAPLVNSRGLRIVSGDIDPADWSQPGEEKIISVIARDAKPGGIIICHDMHAQTANAAGRILDALLGAGLAPVTMSTLMGN
jgi:peptidoglycan/xylan/chitin deacetylase (PgdA/CDA1 family)